MSKIAIALLAAGEGRRMGSEIKQLVRLDHQPLLQRAAMVARQSAVGDVFVVLGYELAQLSQLIERTFYGQEHQYTLSVVTNQHWHEGLSASIRAAVHAARDYDAILFMTVDQPFVDAACLRTIVEAYMESGKDVVASTYGSPLSAGIPALFARAKYNDLLQLKGDRGAKSVIAQSGALLIPSPLAAYDIDTAIDLQTCIKLKDSQLQITNC